MTTSKDLFLSILAMDSYNHGYGAGVDHKKDTIGLASVDALPNGVEISEWESVDFYAISYTIGDGVDGIASGTTVISYRGTDTPLDHSTGWIVVGGNVDDWTQAPLALEFYNAATNKSYQDGRADKVILTGHSLGGGLAGFVSALSGTEGVGFDHMTYGAAALLRAHMDELGVSPGEWSNLTLHERLHYLTYSVIPRPELATPDFRGVHVEGEVLQKLRSGEIAAVGEAGASLISAGLALFGNRVLNEDAVNFLLSADIALSGGLETFARNSRFIQQEYEQNYTKPQRSHSSGDFGGLSKIIDLHSAQLAVALEFSRSIAGGTGTADNSYQENEHWRSISEPLFVSFFNDNVGNSAGFEHFPSAAAGTADKPGSSASAMGRAIAYSALDGSDGLVFGNTGIRAMFDDANELGALVEAGGLPNASDAVLHRFAQAIVQFAGQMALQEVDYLEARLPDAANIDPSEGILSFFKGGAQIAQQPGGQDDFTDAEFLAIDVSQRLWNIDHRTEGDKKSPLDPVVIFGLKELLSELFSDGTEEQRNIIKIINGLNPTEGAQPLGVGRLLEAVFSTPEETSTIVPNFVDKIFFSLDQEAVRADIGDNAQQITDPERGSLAILNASVTEAFGDDGRNVIFAADAVLKTFSGGLGSDVLFSGAGVDRMVDLVGERPDYGAGEDEVIIEGFFNDTYVGRLERLDWLPEFLKWWDSGDDGDAVEYSVLTDLADPSSIMDRGVHVFNLEKATLQGDPGTTEVLISVADLNTGRVSVDRLINVERSLLSLRSDRAFVTDGWLQAPILLDMNDFAANAEVGYGDYDTLDFTGMTTGINLVNAAIEATKAETDASRPDDFGAIAAETPAKELALLLTGFDPFNGKAPLKVEGVEHVIGTDFADNIVFGEVGPLSKVFGGWRENDDPALLSAVSGGAGDDSLIIYNPSFYKAGDVISVADGGSADGTTTAKHDLKVTFDGGDGQDWVLAFGGRGAITIGGTGKDFIFNTSQGGSIFGDTTDGLLIQEGDPIRTWGRDAGAGYRGKLRPDLVVGGDSDVGPGQERYSGVLRRSAGKWLQ